MVKETYDVIVIGGGIAGPACAALLAKKGLKVLVLEKNKIPGGRTMPFSKNGFKWELGPVGVTPLRGHNLDKVYKELGIKSGARLIPPETMMFCYKGRSGKWHSASLTLKEEDELPDPTELFGVWELDAQEQDIAAKILGDIYFMPEEKRQELKEADISFEKYLSQYDNIPTPVYSFLALMANGLMVLPIELINAAEYVVTLHDAFNGGGCYPAGGFGRVVDDLIGALKDNGGELRTGTKVKKINVEAGKVTGVVTGNGEEIRCPILVSSAGIQPTVLKLVGEKHFDKAYVNWVKDLVPTWGFTGQTYMLSKPVFDFHHLCLYTDKSWWNMERYLKVVEGQAPDDIWLYALVSSNYDPSLAPPGKQIVSVGTNCLPDPTDKETTKKLWETTDRIMRERFPELESNIENIEYCGPAHVSAQARDSVVPGQGGEWGGLALIVGQSGPKRPEIKTPIRGLFYVGLDAGSGNMGLHGSTASALKAAEEVFTYRAMRPKDYIVKG